jgi:hypothetical protein
MTTPDADSEYDKDNPDPHGRFLELCWFPVRNDAVQRILQSAQGAPAELVRALHKAAGLDNPGERCAAIVGCLAERLTSPNQSGRRTAGRLLGDAFAPLGRGILKDGSSVPEELEPALPAIFHATALPDSELRLSLLGILGHLAIRRCAGAILPPIIEHLFNDSNPKVIIQALDVVMAAGIDLASVAIPTIVKLLDYPDTRVRVCACEALAKFGLEAGQAVPKLVKLARYDTDFGLQQSAALTLAAVDPEGDRISRELPDQAGRDALLSLLRVVGPPARELRVWLGKRPLPRITLDQDSCTITFDGTPYPGIDPVAFQIFKAIWDRRPARVSSTVLDGLPGLHGKNFSRELKKLPKDLRELVNGAGGSGYGILLPPLSSP